MGKRFRKERRRPTPCRLFNVAVEHTALELEREQEHNRLAAALAVVRSIAVAGEDSEREAIRLPPNLPQVARSNDDAFGRVAPQNRESQGELLG